MVESLQLSNLTSVKSMNRFPPERKVIDAFFSRKFTSSSAIVHVHYYRDSRRVENDAWSSNAGEPATRAELDIHRQCYQTTYLSGARRCINRTECIIKGQAAYRSRRYDVCNVRPAPVLLRSAAEIWVSVKRYAVANSQNEERTKEERLTPGWSRANRAKRVAAERAVEAEVETRSSGVRSASKDSTKIVRYSN